MPLTMLESQVSDAELADRYHLNGDVTARRTMIERYLPFARRLALRYRYTGEAVEDLVQVASIGLIAAVERFDPSRGQFRSYAAPTILGELKRHFRDRGWMVHVSRDLQERSAKVNRATERLWCRLGRSPTMAELADELGWSVGQTLEVSEVVHAYRLTSLDALVSTNDGTASALVECLGREDGHFLLVETRERISEVWQELTELEREVVELRFAKHLTQREIGRRIGYSQMHVSRVLSRTLQRLLATDELSSSDGTA